MNVLIVTTSCNMLAPDHPTGLWLEEFAVPFTAFSEAGASIRVVSPKGGAVPIDPKTAPTEKDREKWPAALQALSSTGRLAEVAADRFDAVFIPGGHGPMVDLVNDQQLQRLLAAFDRDGKMVAAVCHGPAALLNVRNAAGEPLVKGRKVTGFTNVEERLVLLHSVVPFLLEDALKERGANFESALLPFFSHVVRDENLITGQNPASSTKVAEELLAALEEGSRLTS
ncbi:MAG: type 1 glutamine amidotransferase domain-containing protein [Isosphaeraceae bacterium]|jgi:putative intracellular protease/amidase